ncbi:MAG: hypothetical protein KIT22_08275 [Verrucomicrobiae bacterium]|nr:hypothetical protein [Verrucomicrobiae bacterium]
MPDVKDDIVAYTAQQADLEAKHMGKWVLFRDQKLEGVFESFDETAEHAVKLFGRGPYLIRQVGAPALSLPASVMFVPVYA